MVKVVYIYNLKEGVDPGKFEDYYFEKRIPQVMQVKNLEKFCFNIAVDDHPTPYRYMAENYYEDLETANAALDSPYFKDVHGRITEQLADLQVMFFHTHEWIPSEWNEKGQ